MKILHIIDEMGMGGAQSLLVELVPIQKQMGHDVSILELQSVKDRTLVNKLRMLGIEIITVSSKRSVRNPLNIFSIIPYLKKFDIVHVHLFPANYWTAIAKLISLSTTPIITTEHSTNNKRRNISIFKYIDQFIYRQYQEVIACSQKALETFTKRYKGVNCVSIPNGVDISKYINAAPYTHSELLGLNEKAFVISMVARFKYPKRQDILIEAISKLPKYFHAVLVGGEQSDLNLQKMQQYAENLGVQNRVHFLYVRTDVPRILKSSDVIVMSSEYEGLSLSSIEGMACGHPFVASNVNGLKEVVSGVGVLFNFEDSDQLAKILFDIESDRVYYNEISRRCLKRAENYDIRVVANLYEQEYKKYTR